ncbi:hypothetical protein IQ254_11890 [Nodosilinea sp. LEGE 07088]|uniref:hypothetical protein n=1 Tax=Nodosilinea sp. LEGE 07088 TaxID=2777968 RepID=UPI0018820B8A|nr:hypothetical protein [Nodosilinea sp. LEGE 07088]MBE9137884.1 hypothetical protein [Nodosilinea sp. LEGE 07088]
MARKLLLIVCAIVPGMAGVAVFGYYALVDWGALQLAYQNYEAVINQNSGLEAIFVAHGSQNIHRINLFAEGTWTLLSALLAIVGIHGLSTRRA